MTTETTIDYGPLKRLIGCWTGNQGTDIAPEPDGTENSPYYETIEITECGDVSNAEKQTLAVLHYRQIVRRKSNDEIFHDQCGYWMWDAVCRTVMQAFTIPRAVAVLAGGQFTGNPDADSLVLEVSSVAGSADYGIVQSPFMRDNAKTLSFSQQLTVTDNRLSYRQTTMLDIYGREFEHTDTNQLVKS